MEDLALLDDGELHPATRLEGQTLEGGWVVSKKINRVEGQTGGCFSVGYLAYNEETGETAFLKALDFSKMLTGEDPLSQIQSAVSAYQFEQQLLQLCSNKRMSNVVKTIASGYLRIDDSILGKKVPYLLFEPAAGDLRKLISDFSEVELSWATAILHEVSLGLQQLHYAHVAHQDLKPSNVLAFEAGIPFKLSDLGCATSKGVAGPRDQFRFAGALSIAPPELMYGEKNKDWLVSRVGADLYALGSLAVFLFCGSAINAIVNDCLEEEHKFDVWNGTYREALPFVLDAYSDAFSRLEPHFNAPIKSELFQLIKQLCEPDPLRRGNSRFLGSGFQQYDVRRVVSKLGNIRRRAELVASISVRKVR